MLRKPAKPRVVVYKVINYLHLYTLYNLYTILRFFSSGVSTLAADTTAKMVMINAYNAFIMAVRSVNRQEKRLITYQSQEHSM